MSNSQHYRQVINPNQVIIDINQRPQQPNFNSYIINLINLPVPERGQPFDEFFHGYSFP